MHPAPTMDVHFLIFFYRGFPDNSKNVLSFIIFTLLLYTPYLFHDKTPMPIHFSLFTNKIFQSLVLLRNDANTSPVWAEILEMPVKKWLYKT